MSKNELMRYLVFLSVMLFFPFVVGTESYWMSILVIMGIYALIAIGLSLLMGYAGQISLGHAAFFGLGAYASGLLTTRWEMNPWLAMGIAMVGTCGIALLIGMPCLRLRGHYLAMATLAFGKITVIAFTAEIALTGGPAGFGGIPWLSVFGYELGTDLAYYYFVWGVVAVVLLLVLNMIHSRVGRALRSIHGGELAANAMGVNTTFYKVQIFVVSAGLASIAGSFYAHYLTFMGPTACEVKLSILLVIMVTVGGMGHVWGAVIGTVIMTAIPEWLGSLEEMGLLMQDMDFLVYGIIMMVILMFMPDGLYGGLEKGMGLLRRLWPKGGVDHGSTA